MAGKESDELQRRANARTPAMHSSPAHKMTAPVGKTFVNGYRGSTKYDEMFNAK